MKNGGRKESSLNKLPVMFVVKSVKGKLFLLRKDSSQNTNNCNCLLKETFFQRPKGFFFLCSLPICTEKSTKSICNFQESLPLKPLYILKKEARHVRKKDIWILPTSLKGHGYLSRKSLWPFFSLHIQNTC